MNLNGNLDFLNSFSNFVIDTQVAIESQDLQRYREAKKAEEIDRINSIIADTENKKLLSQELTYQISQKKKEQDKILLYTFIGLGIITIIGGYTILKT